MYTCCLILFYVCICDASYWIYSMYMDCFADVPIFHFSLRIKEAQVLDIKTISSSRRYCFQ